MLSILHYEEIGRRWQPYAGLTSPSQSPSRGSRDEDERRPYGEAKTESRRGEKQRAKEDVREKLKRHNHQVSVGEVRHKDASNMENGYWQVSLTSTVWTLEKLQAETSLLTLNESQYVFCTKHLGF